MGLSCWFCVFEPIRQVLEHMEQSGEFRKWHHFTVMQPLKPGKDNFNISRSNSSSYPQIYKEKEEACTGLEHCHETTTGHCNIVLVSCLLNTFLKFSKILTWASFSQFLCLCFLSPCFKSELQLIICTRWEMEGEVGFNKRQAALKRMQLSSVKLALLILENFMNSQHHNREHALRLLWKCHCSQPQHIWDLMPAVIPSHSLPVPSSLRTFGGLPCPFGRFNQGSGGEAKSFHRTLQTQKCQCLGQENSCKTLTLLFFPPDSTLTTAHQNSDSLCCGNILIPHSKLWCFLVFTSFTVWCLQIYIELKHEQNCLVD